MVTVILVAVATPIIAWLYWGVFFTLLLFVTRTEHEQHIA